MCLDLVGTLLCDGGVVERSFVEALLRVGLAPGSPEVAAAIGLERTMKGRSKIEVLRRVLGSETAAHFADGEFETAFEMAIRRGEVGPIPGAAEVLQTLRELDMKICVTTGMSPTARQLMLDTMGWLDHVDLALSPSDVGRGRPFPDMNLRAFLHFALEDVRQMAVAGDTMADLLSGWRAGAGVVAGVLTGAHDRADLEQVPHTHLLGSVVELPAVVANTELIHTA